MRIIKDENISDIILKNKGYKNLMTGIFSDTLEGAINKKRYIITDTEDLGGYYVCIEGHFLSVCFAKLKNIKGKYVWVQKSKKIKIDKAGILKNIKFINITGFDICGQTKTEGEEKFIAPAGACNTIYEFFGGIPHIHMNGNNAYGLTHPLPIEKPIWAFQELADYKYSLKKKDISCRGGIEVIEPLLTTEDKNGQKYFMINQDCNNMRGPYYIIKKEKDKFPPLPQEAYQAMENLFKKLKDSMRIKKNLAENKFSMACLQNVNSICYMRCFQPLLFKENITFEEVRRIRIKNDVEFIKGRYQQGFNNYVAWCDDLSGTILQYTKWLIEEGMDYLEGIEPINRRLLDKYGIRAYDTIFVAGITAVVPIIEMLININTPNQKKIRKMIFSDIVEYWPNIQNAVFDFKIKNHTTNIPFLYKYDLKIDTSKKSLHEILCLPKGIFEYAFEKDGIDILHCMQEMFINEKTENINFLTYMNYDDAMWLFALLEVIGKENASTVSSIVKN